MSLADNIPDDILDLDIEISDFASEADDCSAAPSSSKLDGVMIPVSVGIGRNVAEAQYALFNAKQRKHERRRYNIEIHDGVEIPYQEQGENETVRSYIDLERMLAGNASAMSRLERLKYDPQTGLLNKTGYAVEVMKLKEAGVYNGNRMIILFDGDDMKRANSLLGYENTDDYLAAIGRGLRCMTRQELSDISVNRRGDQDRGEFIRDILGNRMNDSGGDEFIIDVECTFPEAEKIAMRCVDAIYRSQRELSSSKAEMEILEKTSSRGICKKD